ncbi:hypothetical protein [Acetobacter persici]|uniref:Uncharacterized protein n=1 Tax=Komagataeibacter xylinus TaxID=28448 RepID=A0A857FTC7_KOMXY|nr:hypothetical protein [Acetobacter persici]MBS0964413.1 hypothetical protein [Acetobacter persici]QHC37648.1 hypothetical protein FMA36_19020 [Komagataeibacter xylinus]
MTITDFSDERAAKRAAICKARNSTQPAVPADQVLALLDADLARIQAAIDALPPPHSTSLMASRDTGTKDRSRAEDYQ